MSSSLCSLSNVNRKAPKADAWVGSCVTFTPDFHRCGSFRGEIHIVGLDTVQVPWPCEFLNVAQ